MGEEHVVWCYWTSNAWLLICIVELYHSVVTCWSGWACLLRESHFTCSSLEDLHRYHHLSSNIFFNPPPIKASDPPIHSTPITENQSQITHQSLWHSTQTHLLAFALLEVSRQSMKHETSAPLTGTVIFAARTRPHFVLSWQLQSQCCKSRTRNRLEEKKLRNDGGGLIRLFDPINAQRRTAIYRPWELIG